LYFLRYTHIHWFINSCCSMFLDFVLFLENSELIVFLQNLLFLNMICRFSFWVFFSSTCFIWFVEEKKIKG
jgi:hypothetical protein